MSEDLFERRQAARHYSLNFLDYEILSTEGAVIGRGLARTLNLSQAGLRLETGHFFDVGQQLRITLGLKDELVQLVGRVVNSEPIGDDLCNSGIMILELDQGDHDIFKQYFDAL
jgi:hypothetical protein